MNVATAARALELLREAFGEDAEFRDDQLDAILALVDKRSRVLVVQRTGWGKSVVYFIATALRREQGLGPTLLISPLLALMRDQMRMAVTTFGLLVERIDSSNHDRHEEIEGALATDDVDLLLISPERLGNEHFGTNVVRSIPNGIGLFVVDEAHCISDWGHDFRPDYQRIRGVVSALPPAVPLLATTATANARVQADIERQLGPDLVVQRGRLGRDSLHLQVAGLSDQAERMAWLAQYLGDTPGSGIVYTLTVRDADRVSGWLVSEGIDAPAYHAKLTDGPTREEREDALRNNEVKALVATIALGMGFDKPDLAFVVHFQRPGSVVAYYQQIGRAGRAMDRAEVVLLHGREDQEIGDFFVDSAFPPEGQVAEVLDAIEATDEIRLRALESLVNLKRSEIERAVDLLALEGAIAARDGYWARTPNPWRFDPQRGNRVTAIRRREQEHMIEYTATDACLMAFLTTELDDPSDPCGRCANCIDPFAPTTADLQLVQQAQRFLRRAYRPIDPRRQWPQGMEEPRGNIPAEHQLEEGRALSIWGDAGWGAQVREGKFLTRRFDDELVNAVADMLAEWRPDPAPTWVTPVPSSRNPGLVPDFAQRLAERLGLEYHEAVAKLRDTAEQKTMHNSIQQARNVLDALEAVPAEVLPGAVLLVDDMVDSRWSLTVCGVALRRAGAGPVYPVALSQTTSGS